MPGTTIHAIHSQPECSTLSPNGPNKASLHSKIHLTDIDEHDDPRVVGKDDGKRLCSSLEVVPESEKSTESQTVFNMVNAILGAGVLGLPFCYRSCGLILTTLLVLVALAGDEVSLRLLVACKHIAGRQTYEDLAGHTFGALGKHLVETCVLALNLGNLVAFLNILADCCSSVSGTIIPPGAEPSRNVLLAGVTILGALPMVLTVRSPKLMAICSQAVVGFVLLFGVLLTFLALNTVQTREHIDYWRWEGVGVSFPVIAYSSAHHVFFPIYSSMRGASVTKINTVVQKSMVICYALYLLVGASGYALFRDRTAGDLMRNLGGIDVTGLRGVWERALKMGFGLCVLGTIPLVMEPFYSATPLVNSMGALQAVGATHFSWMRTCEEQVLALAVLGCALSAAVILPNVEFIFGLMGSTFSMLLAYILPAAMFLSLTGAKRRSSGRDVELPAGSTSVLTGNRIMAVALLLFGCSAGMVCSTAMLHAVHREAEVVQQATQLAEQQAKAITAVHSSTASKTVAAAFDMIEEATKQLDTAQKQAADAAGVAVEAQMSIVEGLEDGATEGASANRTELLYSTQLRFNSTLKALGDAAQALVNTTQKLQNSTIDVVEASMPLLNGETVSEDDSMTDSSPATVSRVQEVADELSKVLVQPHITAATANTVQKVQEAVSTLNSAAAVASETLSSVASTVAALDTVPFDDPPDEGTPQDAVREGQTAAVEAFIKQVANATAEAASQLDESVVLLNTLTARQRDRAADDEGNDDGDDDHDAHEPSGLM